MRFRVEKVSKQLLTSFDTFVGWTYDRRLTTYATDMRHNDIRKSKSRDVIRISRTS